MPESGWTSAIASALKALLLPRRLFVLWILCLIVVVFLLRFPDLATDCGLGFLRPYVGVIGIGGLLFLLLWVFELPSSETFQNRRLDRALSENIRENLEGLTPPEKQMLWTIYNEDRKSVDLSVLDPICQLLLQRGLLKEQARTNRNLNAIYGIPRDVLKEMKKLAPREARHGRSAPKT